MPLTNEPTIKQRANSLDEWRRENFGLLKPRQNSQLVTIVADIRRWDAQQKSDCQDPDCQCKKEDLS